MNWVKEMLAWIKIKTNVMAAGSMSSNPEYNAKKSKAHTNPIKKAATCPTMVIPLVLILDLMTSLDKPLKITYRRK